MRHAEHVVLDAQIGPDIDHSLQPGDDSLTALSTKDNKDTSDTSVAAQKNGDGIVSCKICSPLAGLHGVFKASGLPLRSHITSKIPMRMEPSS